MPYINFHACLIRPEITKILGTMKRTHNGKSYQVKIGRKKGQTEGSATRSFLYPVSQWSESEARKHCGDHGGRFEKKKE